jgi:thiamine biosynthesis lipoprotein
MITRRLFLSLPAMMPLTALGWSHSGEHHFSYDHVIGTSLDLLVWTPDEAAAQRALAAVLDEVQRLTSILNTRDPDSEISKLGDRDEPASRELREVLSAYDRWTGITDGILSVRPRGANTPRNVDALGKAYIIERAVMAATAAAPDSEGVLLNIGGDIVARGRACDIALADPGAPHENAAPLTRIRLQNAAIATSGTYARGAHLLDARTGRPAARASSGTAVASNAMTANALATALCLTDSAAGLRLVERTPGAEALRVALDGGVERTAGFARLEYPQGVRPPAATAWPAGFELDIALTLTEGTSFRRGRGRVQRPYVAVWVESTSGTLVRVLAFWGSKAKYFSELSSFWNLAGRNRNLVYSTARATRDPGRYQLVWDGLDNDHKPVPPGTYRIVVETNQEHGVYAKQSGTLACGGSPARLTLPATANFDAVTIQYGPRPSRV